MDSGRRSFVGSLMAFLLAPMVVGGCLMPRRKSRRIASEEVAPDLELSGLEMVVSRRAAGQHQTVTIYGSGKVISYFRRKWMGFAPDREIAEHDCTKIKIFYSRDVHESYGGILQDWRIDLAINAVRDAGAVVLDRNADDVMEIRRPNEVSFSETEEHFNLSHGSLLAYHRQRGIAPSVVAVKKIA